MGFVADDLVIGVALVIGVVVLVGLVEAVVETVKVVVIEGIKVVLVEGVLELVGCADGLVGEPNGQFILVTISVIVGT